MHFPDETWDTTSLHRIVRGTLVRDDIICDSTYMYAFMLIFLDVFV